MTTTAATTVDLVALLAECEAERADPRSDLSRAVAAYETERAAEDERARHRRGAGQGLPAAERCGRCGGSGHLPAFRHIAGGDCFACDATGVAGMARY